VQAFVIFADEAGQSRPDKVDVKNVCTEQLFDVGQILAPIEDELQHREVVGAENPKRSTENVTCRQRPWSSA
jgi:hypothetical protein